MIKVFGTAKNFFHNLKHEKSTDAKMSTGEIWSYGLCDFGKTSSQNLISGTYLNLFLTVALGIDVVAVGILMTVTTIIGYVKGPIISLLEDSTKTKWGRFRPYFIISAPLSAALALIFFFNPFYGNGTANLIWVYTTYILFGISEGFCTTAWNGLTKCITHDAGERQKAFSISKGLSILSTSLPSWLPTLMEFGPKYLGMSVKMVFAVMAGILGVIGFLALLTARNLRERVMITRSEKPWKNLGMVFKNKNIIITWLGNLGLFFSYEANYAAPFVIMYCYGAYSLQTFVWGIAGIFAWIPLLFSNKIYKWFSSKMIIYLYNILTIVANIILYLFGYGTSFLLIGVLFATRSLAAIFEYVTTVATTMITTDIWDHYEWKYGIRNESTTDLVGSWVIAPISILNPLIYAWLFSKIGFRSGDNVIQSASTIDWFFKIFCIATSISCFLTMLPYFFIRLNKKQMAEIRKELEERRLARQGASPAMALALEAGGTVTGEIVSTQEEVSEEE